MADIPNTDSRAVASIAAALEIAKESVNHAHFSDEPPDTRNKMLTNIFIKTYNAIVNNRQIED